MSVHVMSPVLDNSESRLATRLVLIAIADQANDHGWCWPSIESIQRRTRIKSRQTVVDALSRLEEMGELEVFERYGRSHVYRVVVKGVRVQPISLDEMRPPGLPTTATPRVFQGDPDPPQGLDPTPPKDQGDTPPNPWGDPLQTLSHEPLGTVIEPSLNHAPKRRDLIFETLAELWGRDPGKLTKNERGHLNAAVKQLREVGATPEEIRVRHGRYRVEWPGVEWSPGAMAKHWGRFAEPPKPSGMVNQPGERPAPGDCPLIGEHGVSQVCRVCLYERKDTT